MKKKFCFRSMFAFGGLALVWSFNTMAGGHQHAEGKGVQALDVYSDGDSLHLLIAEARKEGEPPELTYLSSRDGETWSAPARVDAGLPAPHNVHRGMDPQIAASGKDLIAVWMTKGTGYADSGPLVTALSEDGGKTWRQGANPADDGTTSGHGFVDVAADRSGRFYLTWLDSRDGKQGLRFSSSADKGISWAPNTTVKSGTCECCWNAMAVAPGGGLAILFRDRNPRDMGLAWSSDAGETWPKPRPVGNFGWQFEGCPHVGGGIAIDTSSRIHTVVWNGAPDNRGVFYLSSNDEGASWTRPRRLGGEDASHPDLAVGESGPIAAVWDIYTGDGTGVQAAVSVDGGATWAAPLTLTGKKVTAGHPKVVATTEGFRIFWTESEPGRPVVWRSSLLRK